MPPYERKTDPVIQTELTRAEQMHNFILGNCPQQLKLDTDAKQMVGAFFTLPIEHQGAILTLIRKSGFRRDCRWPLCDSEQ